MSWLKLADFSFQRVIDMNTGKEGSVQGRAPDGGWRVLWDGASEVVTVPAGNLRFPATGRQGSAWLTLRAEDVAAEAQRLIEELGGDEAAAQAIAEAAQQRQQPAGAVAAFDMAKVMRLVSLLAAMGIGMSAQEVMANPAAAVAKVKTVEQAPVPVAESKTGIPTTLEQMYKKMDWNNPRAVLTNANWTAGPIPATWEEVFVQMFHGQLTKKQPISEEMMGQLDQRMAEHVMVLVAQGWAPEGQEASVIAALVRSRYAGILKSMLTMPAARYADYHNKMIAAKTTDEQIKISNDFFGVR